MNFDQKNNIGFNYVIDKLNPKSAIGQKALKKLLPFSSAQQIKKEYDNVAKAIDLFTTNKKTINEIENFLSQIKDIYSTFLKLGENLTSVELFEIKNFCYCLIKICNLLNNLPYQFEDIDFADLSKAYDLLFPNYFGFYFYDEYSTTLATIREKKKKTTTALLTATQQQKDTLTQEHLNLSVLEQEEESKISLYLSNELKKFKELFVLNYNSIAKLDLIIQKATLATNFGAIIPTISNDEFCLIEAYNPYIKSFLQNKSKDFVPITINLKTTTIITGANMGGKTVALKTVALNAYLFCCGIPVFSKKATIPFLNFVEILSEDLQSTERGLSSFGGEITKINTLFKKAKKSKGLLLIDEFAGGTNVEEGKKIFSALLKALNNTPSFALLTTHFDDVSQYATKRYQIIGLSSQTKAKLNSITNASEQDLSNYIDYGLIMVDNNTQIPKDAIDICKILGLDNEIISLI